MKTLIFLLFLPFFSKAQPDTVKIVMLVSDTSTVESKPAWYVSDGLRMINSGGAFLMQDTRPYMTYGYQTSTGEILDAYKKKLGKNIIMWIAYKTK